VHACSALAELLPQAASLAGLHLFNNMSGDEGAGHVASLLLRCPGMCDFKMASSRVGPAGGISLAKALMAGALAACTRPGRDTCCLHSAVKASCALYCGPCAASAWLLRVHQLDAASTVGVRCMTCSVVHLQGCRHNTCCTCSS
jgi:hypothetical protein